MPGGSSEGTRRSWPGIVVTTPGTSRPPHSTPGCPNWLSLGNWWGVGVQGLPQCSRSRKGQSTPAPSWQEPGAGQDPANTGLPWTSGASLRPLEGTVPPVHAVQGLPAASLLSVRLAWEAGVLGDLPGQCLTSAGRALALALTDPGREACRGWPPVGSALCPGALTQTPVLHILVCHCRGVSGPLRMSLQGHPVQLSASSRLCAGRGPGLTCTLTRMLLTCTLCTCVHSGASPASWHGHCHLCSLPPS